MEVERKIKGKNRDRDLVGEGRRRRVLKWDRGERERERVE